MYKVYSKWNGGYAGIVDISTFDQAIEEFNKRVGKYTHLVDEIVLLDQNDKILKKMLI